MDMKRNIILITGRSAVGKTTAAKYLRDQCFLHNIPCEDRVISDALSLLKVLQKDDDNGGFHHTHEWCEPSEHGTGHSHLESPSMLPFIVTDNTLPDDMLSDFFTELKNIPGNDKIYIAELAGGAKPADSESEIDYSYAKIARILREQELSGERKLPVDWLNHVYLVIHLVATDENRLVFNEKRSVFSSEDVLDGVASWQTDTKVLEFYQRDDFDEIEDILNAYDIHIYTIRNDGSNSLFKKLDELILSLSSIFSM
jgi:hypothetical protein